MKHSAFHGDLLTRPQIEAQIERLIDILDVLDGDSDREDGDEDACAAHDDDPAWHYFSPFSLPGDEDDAEDDDSDRCEAGDDGCGYFQLGGQQGWGSDAEDCV